MSSLPKSARELVLNATMMLVAVAGTLTTMEVLSRAVLTSRRYEFPEWMYETVENPMLGYRMVPDFRGKVYNRAYEYEIRTNSLGFRGPEITTDGKKIIGVFGDSFGYGQGVQEAETFSAVLREAVEDRGYEVVNTSHAGYATAQEYEMYRLLNKTLDLHTVILQVYVNDIKDQSVPLNRTVYRGVLYARAPTNQLEVMKGWALTHSELAAQLAFGVWEIRRSGKGNEIPIPVYLRSDYEDRAASKISSTRDLIACWAEEAEAKGQRFVVFYIPHRTQVEPDWKAAFSTGATDSGPELDWDVAHRWLQRLVDERYLVYVDVVSRFRETYAAGGGPLYFIGNNHMNAEGHRLIGEALAEVLQAGTDVATGSTDGKDSRTGRDLTE